MKGTIFGGAGFIGSSIVSLLDDIEWVAVDDLSLGTFTNIRNPSAKKVRGDISDPKSVDSILKDSPDYVMMMNGLSSNPHYYPDPRRGYQTMLMGALNVFDACRRYDIKKVIYAATSSVYGNTNVNDQRENINISPPNFYSCAKRGVEDAARIYAEEYGIYSVGFRYFSVYGYPERHKGIYANIVTQFIWDMIKSKKPVIYGNGNQTRDFIFINDIVEANRLAVMKRLRGAYIMNVGTGVNHSFNDVIALINKHLGTMIKPEYTPNQIHNYIFDTLADTKKAEELLGFKAKTPLDEGIKKTLAFYKQGGLT